MMTLKRDRWRALPHNRVRCPDHGVEMVVRSGVGAVGYCYCPIDGCVQRGKCRRELVIDDKLNSGLLEIKKSIPNEEV